MQRGTPKFVSVQLENACGQRRNARSSLVVCRRLRVVRFGVPVPLHGPARGRSPRGARRRRHPRSGVDPGGGGPQAGRQRPGGEEVGVLQPVGHLQGLQPFRAAGLPPPGEPHGLERRQGRGRGGARGVLEPRGVRQRHHPRSRLGAALLPGALPPPGVPLALAPGGAAFLAPAGLGLRLVLENGGAVLPARERVGLGGRGCRLARGPRRVCVFRGAGDPFPALEVARGPCGLPPPPAVPRGRGVVVHPFVRCDDARRVAAAALHVLPHAAALRRAFVVGPRVRVALHKLLPVLAPPVAVIQHVHVRGRLHHEPRLPRLPPGPHPGDG
mmetsp:Transcript_6946/g.19666  ORF Transcript_6946/g.19666 Transcript_6946/m.19666 type:complete len:328 (+) Transcript_6946:1104-2087(+)